MTRDSRLLFALKIAALVLGTFALVSDPAAYGIGPVAFKWIGFSATIMGTISGWLSSSPLPGVDDAVDPKGRS